MMMMMMLYLATLYSLGPDITILVWALLLRDTLYLPQEYKSYANVAFSK